MFRPRGFADLAGRRVGIWGYGVEGRALARLLEGRCELVIVDDAPAFGTASSTPRREFSALTECDVVFKTPGIPRRRHDVLDLEEKGIALTSGMNMWLHDANLNHVIAVTGTKGKSTTTTLLTFFLQCAGFDAHSAGNIGQPPYELTELSDDSWVVLEVSSFQAVDIDVAPRNVAVTSLGSDHLDWHGTLEQYHDDKLSITRARGDHITWCANDPVLHEERARLGGDVRFVDGEEVELARELGLLGSHNARNTHLALVIVAHASGLDIEELRRRALERSARYTPLAGRLRVVAALTVPRGAIRFVDDGLATAPLPTLAALEVFRDEQVVLILGGFDRGVDYSELVDALAQGRERISVIVSGPAGRRIESELAARNLSVLGHVDQMDDVVALAANRLSHGGVVLLSPAAPSFDRYKNWEERSQDFARAVSELIAHRRSTHT